METPPPKKGMGCFTQGCFTLVIVAVVVAIVAGIVGWWIYGKAINSFTSDRWVEVRLDEPSAAAFQQAEANLNRLRNAVTNKTTATIEFSPSDLNTLIARDVVFAGLRGKLRVNMTGNDMVLDLSAPLDSIPLPRFKGRWFNGRAQFGFAYESDKFSFTGRSLEANGHRIQDTGDNGLSSSFLRSSSSSFTKSFNQSFHLGRERTPQGAAVWQQIKSMSVQNGQLVVEIR